MLPSFFLCSLATPAWTLGLAYTAWTRRSDLAAGFPYSAGILVTAGIVLLLRLLLIAFAGLASRNFGHGLKGLEFISRAQEENDEDQPDDEIANQLSTSQILAPPLRLILLARHFLMIEFVTLRTEQPSTAQEGGATDWKKETWKRLEGKIALGIKSSGYGGLTSRIPWRNPLRLPLRLPRQSFRTHRQRLRRFRPPRRT